MIDGIAFAAAAVVVVVCCVGAFAARRLSLGEDAWFGARRRKAEFLRRYGRAYGYGSSPGGHIDGWRWRELPGLLRPISLWRDHGGEVYLDYAGAALATASQAEAARRSGLLVLGNPHAAGGPAAERSAAVCERARALVARHLGCDSSYDVVWTSGATASLKLVSELFPWRCGSTFWYGSDAHTSLVGCRYVAEARGATSRCLADDDWDDASNRARKGCFTVTFQL